jgi:branched-subunit amino acid transport protein
VIKQILIVVAMALVTYIPRLVPILFLKDKKLTPYLESFLKLIPVAALGALIFPQILTSTGNITSAAFGCVIALICAYFELNVIIVVLGGILGVFAFETFFI